MIISKNWLAEYVPLPTSLDELTERLTLAGLNLDGVEQVGEDTAIDLEVTSNRPDCLGHLGVAREVSVLWGEPLRQPNPQPTATAAAASQQIAVQIDSPHLCSRYTARVIKGVQVGPSPEWLAKRLQTVGIAVINNVVDITNYVLFECGQPLHAFDLEKLNGRQIIVREAQSGETFTAIDHKTYALSPGTCVIADRERAIALGGVMGGAETEVSDTTTDLLIEAADFDPLSVRTTARAHNLQSPSSHRFERGVDPEGIDWASRRCCELILALAGGELLDGVVTAGKLKPAPSEIKLRYSQIPRLLGIEIENNTVRKILTDLGCQETHACDHCVKTLPPTWRADLTREVDLLEEVARIYGYDKIPEDIGVRMAPSHRSRQDIVLERTRHLLIGAGFDEALTLSTVEPESVEAFRPWSQAAPLVTSTPLLRRANALRQSIVPSLLRCRRTNETLSNPVIEHFEIAHVYLPTPESLPDEKRLLALASGRSFLEIKGIIEALITSLTPHLPLVAQPIADPTILPWLDATHRCTLSAKNIPLGYLGELSPAGREEFNLFSATTVAELDLGPLIAAAVLIPRATTLATYPPVSRDLNVVFHDTVAWADVEPIVRRAAGPLLETLTYQETYRDAKRLGPGRKSLLFSITLRSAEGTLTSEQADQVREQIVAVLGSQLGGELRAG